MLALPTGSETVLKESSNESEVLPQTAVRTYQLYCSKVSVSEIAAKRNLTTATIENHLVECVRAGFPLDISQFVSAIDRVQIDAAISKHGMEKLKPIHDDLPETITYNMIRFVLADRQRLQTTADTTSLETRWKTNNA
jgi:ATP-dependent DNA helicase RecQ